MSAALTALATEAGKPHLIPTLARVESHIGPAQRGLSDLGDHNAQPAWGAEEIVHVEGYKGHHWRNPNPGVWPDGTVYISGGYVYRVDGPYPDDVIGGRLD